MKKLVLATSGLMLSAQVAAAQAIDACALKPGGCAEVPEINAYAGVAAVAAIAAVVALIWERRRQAA